MPNDRNYSFLYYKCIIYLKDIILMYISHIIQIRSKLFRMIETQIYAQIITKNMHKKMNEYIILYVYIYIYINVHCIV
jgi:hypothetical protein